VWKEPAAWGPPRWHGWLLCAAGLLSLALLPVVDTAGRLLVGALAVALGALGARDLLLDPVLEVDETSLTVVDGLHRLTVPATQVERIRVVTDRRTPLLEVDLGETIVVLSSRRLGAPVDAVAAELSG
jgi:hypothetical protein